MDLPCRHLRPASITLHLEESIITGTRAMSGSAARRFTKRTMAASESSMPSSMLMSMTWAPFSTCCRATDRASSYCSSRMSRAKRRDPVTFVRSPTFTKSDASSIVKGSRPERRQAGAISGTFRGAWPRTFSAIARTCSGVVPQHPPTMFRKPDAANSSMISAIASGPRSYSPKAFGSPAFGCAETGTSAMRESVSR